MTRGNKVPHVFVGTMYSQEGDFEECIKFVRKQRNVIVTHHIVAGLPEKEAHNALWDAWRSAKSDHDLFVKVDADTVLIADTTLSDVWEQFAANPRVTGLQAPLLDYMTDGLINGLNAFSPKVMFNDTKHGLFCDRQVDTGHDVVVRDVLLPQKLQPAGLHCFSATERQAFHFGLHRALKGQYDIIAKVKKAWERDRDKIRWMALEGATNALKLANDFNYNDNEFKVTFENTLLNNKEP